jgi:hypothetical protein
MTPAARAWAEFMKKAHERPSPRKVLDEIQELERSAAKGEPLEAPAAPRAGGRADAARAENA